MITTPFTRFDIEKALTNQQIQTMIIIRIALMMGVIFFYGAVFLIYSTQENAAAPTIETSVMDILSLVHAVFTFSAFFASTFISNLMLNKNKITESTPEFAALQAINLFRTSSIVQIAIIEAAAMFGAIICLIAAQNGILHTFPSYWVNAGSAVLMIAVGLKSFPTKEYVVTTCENIFLKT